MGMGRTYPRVEWLGTTWMKTALFLLRFTYQMDSPSPWCRPIPLYLEHTLVPLLEEWTTAKYPWCPYHDAEPWVATTQLYNYLGYVSVGLKVPQSISCTVRLCLPESLWCPLEVFLHGLIELPHLGFCISKYENCALLVSLVFSCFRSQAS